MNKEIKLSLLFKRLKKDKQSRMKLQKSKDKMRIFKTNK